MSRFVILVLSVISSGWIVLLGLSLSIVSGADAAQKLPAQFVEDLEKAKTLAEQNDIIRGAKPNLQ